MAGLHANRGAERAREARADLGLDEAKPLPCLPTVVEEDAGIPVLVHALPRHVAGCYGGLVVDDLHTTSRATRGPLEIEANAFAAEFLVPRCALDEVLGSAPAPCAARRCRCGAPASGSR